MLYLLSRIYGVEYEEYEAMLIRAKDSKRARIIADKKSGDKEHAFLNCRIVSCRQISSVGKEEVIIMDFKAA